MRSLARELRARLDMLVMDFDGTIFDEEAADHVAADLRDLIDAFVGEGGAWVVATGRDLSSLAIEIDGRFPCRPAAVVVLDQLIHLHDGSRFREHSAYNDEVRARLASGFDSIPQQVERFRARVRECVGEVLYEDELSPLCVTTQTADELDIVERIAGEEIAAQWAHFARNATYGRVARRGIDKGSGVREVCRVIGCSGRRAAAAGDDLNDLSMLTPSVAGWLVAPANAVGEVRRRVLEHGGVVSSLRAGRGVVDGFARLRHGPRVVPRVHGSEPTR